MKDLKMPPLMLGLGLLFWGWQTNIWLFSIPFAILYEASHFTRWRWNFSDVDIRRAASISTVSLIGIYTYIAVTGGWLNSVTIFFRGLPLIVYPILILQAYSIDEKINFRSLLFFVKFDPEIAKQKRNFSLRYPYFLMTVLCASAAAQQSISFYLGLLAITLFPLWQRRSPRFNLATWLCMLILAANLGFVGQIGLHRLHLYMEEQAISWLSKFYQGESDPFKQSTAIGQIGSIKQSNKIVFRVQSPTQKVVPRLFREAAFNKYQGGLWIATDNEFTALSPDDQDNWQWQTIDVPAEKVIIIDKTVQGKALLKLPQGSFKVEELQAKSLERNQYGSVRLEDQRNSLRYQVNFQTDYNFDSPPNKSDLLIPSTEEETLRKVIETNQFKNLKSQEVLTRLEAFFLKNFQYSLDLAGAGKQTTPLASFLLDQHKGHCEYFATATTLLLREMGIPARYTVGYSVHEYNEFQKQYLVRDRHAHAWTSVYMDGHWQDFDTTPPSWTEIEDQENKRFTFFSDLLSWIWLQIKFNLRDILTPENIRRWWWIILPILLLRMWTAKSDDQGGIVRKFLAKRNNRQQKKSTNHSQFEVIEKALTQAGLARDHSQPIQYWLQELKQDENISEMITDLENIVQWHYRDRFDPNGLSAAEHQQFKMAIQVWLKQWQTKSLV